MWRMEIAKDSLYKAKLIRRFCHLYNNQEVMIVGMETTVRMKDRIATAYCDHHMFLSRDETLL
jgi:pyruvate dehydrogenase E1 component alpha subunit